MRVPDLPFIRRCVQPVADRVAVLTGVGNFSAARACLAVASILAVASLWQTDRHGFALRVLMLLLVLLVSVAGAIACDRDARDATRRGSDTVPEHAARPGMMVARIGLPAILSIRAADLAANGVRAGDWLMLAAMATLGVGLYLHACFPPPPRTTRERAGRPVAAAT